MKYCRKLDLKFKIYIHTHIHKYNWATNPVFHNNSFKVYLFDWTPCYLDMCMLSRYKMLHIPKLILSYIQFKRNRIEKCLHLHSFHDLNVHPLNWIELIHWYFLDIELFLSPFYTHAQHLLQTEISFWVVYLRSMYARHQYYGLLFCVPGKDLNSRGWWRWRMWIDRCKIF